MRMGSWNGGYGGHRRGLPVWLSQAAYVLIAANVAVFLLDAVLPGRPLTIAGAKFGPNVWAGEYYRLITPVFLHADLFHLAMNAFGIYFIGTMIEASIGPRRFLLLYFLSGAAGAAAGVLFAPFVPSVGASGAVFGMFGYILYLRWRSPFSVPPQLSQWVRTILILNVVISILPGTRIDMWGHFGGLAGGFLAGAVVGLPRATPWATPKDRAGALIAAVVLGAFFLLSAMGPR